MGASISQLERDIGSDFPANEHYFGLVNVSSNWFNLCVVKWIKIITSHSLETLAIQILFFKHSTSVSH